MEFIKYIANDVKDDWGEIISKKKKINLLTLKLSHAPKLKVKKSVEFINQTHELKKLDLNFSKIRNNE